MLKKLAVTKNGDLIEHATLQQLSSPDIAWYWIDFYAPTEKEAALLKEFFSSIRLRLKTASIIYSGRSLIFTKGIYFSSFMPSIKKHFDLKKSTCLLEKTISLLFI